MCCLDPREKVLVEQTWTVTPGSQGLSELPLTAKGPPQGTRRPREEEHGHGGGRGGKDAVGGPVGPPHPPCQTLTITHGQAGSSQLVGTVIWEPCLWTPNPELLSRLSGIGTDIAGGLSWTKYHQACL